MKDRPARRAKHRLVSAVIVMLFAVVWLTVELSAPSPEEVEPRLLLGAKDPLRIRDGLHQQSSLTVVDAAKHYPSIADALNASQTIQKAKRDSGHTDQSSHSFFIGLLSAIAIKLTSSIDDVVWLVPFLVIRNKRKVVMHVSIYLWVCLIQAVLALAMAQGGVAALDAMTGKGKGWSSDKILSVGAGAGLFAYGLWLAREWWIERQEGDDDDGGDGDGDGDDNDEEGGGEKGGETRKLMEGESGYGSKTGPEAVVDEAVVNGGHDGGEGDIAGFCERLFECAPCGGGDDGGAEGSTRKERSTNSLFIVAFLGSLDDLTLFIPMLVGKAMNWLELLIGTTVAASIIVLVCIFLGLCKPVARVLESIPLFVIVLLFGSILLCKGLLTMH